MKKTFNSKNLSSQIQNLLDNGQENLALDILQANELKNILPNIISILKRNRKKKEDNNQLKFYSKTDIDKIILKKLSDILKIDPKNADSNSKIIIDENMSAGVKIKAGNMVIDATLDTMLANAIEKIFKK